MGDGPPFPDPVKFDHARADTVITEANSLIGKLQGQTADRVSHAQMMRRNWKGPYALQFDIEVDREQTEARRMIGDLQVLVRVVTNASASATTTQQQHDRATQDWSNQQPDPGPVPGI